MTGKCAEFSREKCRFCQIGAGHAYFDHDRILMESENYFAVASIGGFIEGWTLVCTKRHVLNLSADYCSDEFMAFSIKVADAVSAAYGQLKVFEHGVQQSGSLTGCGTDHAHLHLVPFKNSLVQQVLEVSSDQLWIRTAAQDAKKIADGREYLLMADSPADLAEKSYLSIVNQPQSQFFRRIMASYLGMDHEANYRDFPFQDKAESTVRQLMKAIAKRSPVTVA